MVNLNLLATEEWLSLLSGYNNAKMITIFRLCQNCIPCTNLWSILPEYKKIFFSRLAGLPYDCIFIVPVVEIKYHSQHRKLRKPTPYLNSSKQIPLLEKPICTTREISIVCLSVFSYCRHGTIFYNVVIFYDVVITKNPMAMSNLDVLRYNQRKVTLPFGNSHY